MFQAAEVSRGCEALYRIIEKKSERSKGEKSDSIFFVNLFVIIGQGMIVLSL